MSLNLATYLDIAATAHPERTAVILDEYRMTYSELNAFAKRIANILNDKGIRKGDKVAMMIPNTPHFPMIYYGILYSGATVVPVNVLLKAHEIQYYLEDSDSKIFFAWQDYYDDARHAFDETETCHHLILVSAPHDSFQAPEGENLMPLLMEASHEFEVVETMPDDTAVILYTSGTTGHPKGAELTHFNMFFNAYYVKDQLASFSEHDVSLAVLPLFHSFGQTCVMNVSLMAGSTITMAARFEAERVMEIIQRDKVTVLSMVPTMYYYLLNSDQRKNYDLSTIRLAFSGGSALPVNVLSRFEEEFRVRILEGYGLSETSPVASFSRVDKPMKPGSIGVPIWGCDMRIMREDGTFADTGEVGEIVIRGHNVMKGYYKKPIATQEAIVNGWFHSGDMAYVDDEGYFFIVDRKKDMIIRGGMNIYPREIEEILYAHPAVLEVSVVGIPSEARGEEVKAFIALRDGLTITQEELTTYCRERMAHYKCPREFEFLPELPKGPTGKVLKRELRAQHAGKP